MNLHPGDLFSYVDNRGVLRTERRGEQPTATYPNLPWWRRVLRALTPPRFRKPLKPVWNDPLTRSMRLHQDALETISRLHSTPHPRQG